MFVDEITKSIFLNLLKQGLGFSLSCSKVSIDIEQASIKYLEDADLKDEIDNAFKLGLVDLLAENDKILKQEDKEYLIEINQLIKGFISKPCLWCSGLNSFQMEAMKEDGYLYISSEMILKGVAIYGNLYETATAYGQTYSEILEVVHSDTKLRNSLTSKK